MDFKNVDFRLKMYSCIEVRCEDPWWVYILTFLVYNCVYKMGFVS